MGKKNKKFKNKKIYSNNSSPAPAKIELDENRTIEPVMREERVVIKEETEVDHYKTDKYAHVKKDIAKILVIMTSILILLLVIYFISLKTTYLTSLGDFIYRISHIQTS
jgi:hypothetical protein